MRSGRRASIERYFIRRPSTWRQVLNHAQDVIRQVDESVWRSAAWPSYVVEIPGIERVATSSIDRLGEQLSSIIAAIAVCVRIKWIRAVYCDLV